MSIAMIKIFISSVQKELTEERYAVKRFIENDPLLQSLFMVFLFEELPACDRNTGEVFLAEVDRCNIYLGIFGNDYGYEDAEGISPTEREFDHATNLGKTRLIFVKGEKDQHRHPKMTALIRKAGNQLIRRRFTSIDELNNFVYASLVDYLKSCGIIQSLSFEDRPVPGLTVNDLDATMVANFLKTARNGRKFPLPENSSISDVLTHLNLLNNGQPTNAAVLLFGLNPQRYLPAAEVRCMHFHGTEIQRPVPSYQIYQGTIFSQVDMAVDFVMSKLNRSVGNRAESSQAPGQYEISPNVIREAIVNAIAHRDYTSSGAIQVSLFADRVEIWNPGNLPAPLTTESLRHPHSSIARNHRICEVLFLSQYIEKYGTGTMMMIRENLEYHLPEPDFLQRGSEFTVTIWRDWLTDEVLAKLGLLDRQLQAVAHVKRTGRITNSEYQQLVALPRKTATRDLDDLVEKSVFVRVGEKRGAHYILAKKK